MKKTFIILCILTLCITFYSLSQAYAVINTLPTTPNNTRQSKPTTGYINTASTPNVKPCGDSIIDPRPK
jgi:hypothetical protein